MKFLEIIIMVFVGFAIGFLLSDKINNLPPKGEFAYLEQHLPYKASTCVTSKENYFNGSTLCEFKLTPKTISVTFLPRELFDIAMPPFDTNSRTLGFARIEDSPCRIYLPIDEDTIIHSSPIEGGASWNYTQANTLAHEILHCYTGFWHGTLKLMALAQKVSHNKFQHRFEADPKSFTFVYLGNPEVQPFELVSRAGEFPWRITK